MPRRRGGLFVVLEGPDKSGKSTQALMLQDALQKKGRKVLHTREPGGTSAAEQIRRVLLDPSLHIAPTTELFLYEAARAQHVHEKINPALADKKVVVCERYTLSTDVYQGLARKIGIKTTNALSRYATGGVEPDVTIVIDIPVDEFDTRDRKRELDRLERESLDFRRKVRNGYLALAKGKRNVFVVNGKLSPDDVHSRIMAHVEKKLG